MYYCDFDKRNPTLKFKGNAMVAKICLLYCPDYLVKASKLDRSIVVIISLVRHVCGNHPPLKMARLLCHKIYKTVFMKKIFKQPFSIAVMLLLLMAAIAGGCNTSSHMKVPATGEEFTRAVDSSGWVFRANVAMPQYGGSRQISGYYTVVYSNKKLSVYLPYYGRANAGADVLSSRGPLDFSSVDLIYDKRPAKRGGWNITIKPRDNAEVQSMNFSYFDNGNADLLVTLSNRSPISFTGTLEPAKQ